MLGAILLTTRSHISPDARPELVEEQTPTRMHPELVEGQSSVGFDKLSPQFGA
jgi:hypothetical protein